MGSGSVCPREAWNQAGAYRNAPAVLDVIGSTVNVQQGSRICTQLRVLCAQAWGRPRPAQTRPNLGHFCTTLDFQSQSSFDMKLSPAPLFRRSLPSSTIEHERSTKNDSVRPTGASISILVSRRKPISCPFGNTRCLWACSTVCFSDLTLTEHTGHPFCHHRSRRLLVRSLASRTSPAQAGGQTSGPGIVQVVLLEVGSS